MPDFIIGSVILLCLDKANNKESYENQGKTIGCELSENYSIKAK